MDRLSLIIRTLPHTGHPHPVLSSSTSVIFLSGITCKTSEKRDQLGSGEQTITTFVESSLTAGDPEGIPDKVRAAAIRTRVQHGSEAPNRFFAPPNGETKN